MEEVINKGIVSWRPSKNTDDYEKTPNIRDALGEDIVIVGYDTLNGQHGAFALIRLMDGRKYISGHKVIQQQLFEMESEGLFEDAEGIRCKVLHVKPEGKNGFPFYMFGTPDE